MSVNTISFKEKVIGPAYMCLAAFCFAGLDAALKLLVHDYPLVEIIWVRYAVQTIVIALIFAPRMKATILRTGNLPLQIVRGLCLLAASLLVITGLSHLPLTESTALTFLAPIIVTILSGPVLGERARAIDWLAVGLGFLGVLIIVRPGGGLLTWMIIFPIGTAFCNAIYQLLTRYFHSSENRVTTNLYTGMVGMVLLGPAIPFMGVMPDLKHAGWMLLAGLFGALGHFMVTKAIAHASAVSLSVYSYSQLMWASWLGYVMFGALPDVVTWFGIGVISLGGLLLSIPHLLSLRNQPT